MPGKHQSIWLISFGVVLAHGVLFFGLSRPSPPPPFPKPLDEDPVFVVLVPPPPENKKKQKGKQTPAQKSVAPQVRKTARPEPAKPSLENPAPTAPPTTTTEVPTQEERGAELVFIPGGNTQSKTALGAFFKSWSCTKLDGQGRPVNCEKRKINLMQGYDDEIKRIAQKADALLYLKAGSPKLRRPEDVSLMNRDPMASISLNGGPQYDLGSAKELENLHKYKDPVFGD
ncbi:MAG: hypothetical protein COA84_07855 [Robiginitomaculum sp.]|nr:MAG: hypothetical protein COA84_07855 [Robiginitomaculum sp.]